MPLFRNFTTPRHLALTCTFLAALTPLAVQADDTQTRTLAENVTGLRLHGAGTALQVKTVAGRALSIETEDSFGCTLSATLTEQEGGILAVEVVAGGWRFGPWCDPDVTLSMPEGLALEIGLENLAADINGHFGAISITSQSSVVQFEGRASGFQVNGRQAALRLNFPPDMAREAVRIDVPLLMSEISFEGAS